MATAILAGELYAANENRDDLYDRLALETAQITLYQDARACALREAVNLAGYVILGDPAAPTAIDRAAAEVDVALAQLEEEALAHDPASLPAVDVLQAKHDALSENYQRVIALIQGGDAPGAVSFVASHGVDMEAAAFLDDLSLAVTDSRAQLLSAQQAASGAEARSDRTVLATSIAGAAVVVAAGFATFAWVIRPIEAVSRAARAVASGDRAARAPARGPRELAGLGADVNRMADSLIDRASQLQRLLEDEKERARHDPLTGTLNHGAIVDALRRQIEKDDALAVAMIDVDKLKEINDSHGHQMGDEVLIAVAEALSHDGALVGRYGGDEFVAILPDADAARGQAYAATVAERLAAAALRDEQTGEPVPVVASIGIAVCPEQAATVNELIRLSDRAMYGSKRQRPAARKHSEAA